MITTTTAKALIRQLVQDSDATAQGLSDAQLLVYLNMHYDWIYQRGEPRLKFDNASTTGLTVAAGAYSVTTTPTNYAKIHALFASNTSPLNPISIVPLEELFTNIDASVTGLRPDNAAIHRNTDGKWTVYTSRAGAPSTGTLISAVVELEPTALTSGGTIVLRDSEAYLLTVMAALDAAMALGRDARPGLVQNLREERDLLLQSLGWMNTRTERPRGARA